MNTEPAPNHRRSFRARWLFPVDADPIENGTIEITDGRISALHTKPDNRQTTDLGNVAVIPGLVNAHTHLEFSDLSQPLAPADPFADWIRAVVGHRLGRTTPAVERVQSGLRECVQSGTTALAEIVTNDETLPALRTPGPTVCALRELIGFRPDTIDEQLTIARTFLSGDDRDGATPLVRGLSPHAPYSVHPQLFEQLVDIAANQRALVAVHLAETKAELEFLERGSGPFVALLQEFGVWSPEVIPAGSRPIDYLRQLERLDRALIVHGNYLSDDEIRFVADRPNLTVVYCPRTHAYFGHSEHPWRQLWELGGSVAIGTDSRASNPDLSLWRELCFLRERYPAIVPSTWLRLGTVRGAGALNLLAADWSLAIGSQANLVVLNLPASDARDPYALLFDSRTEIHSTMRNGSWIG